MGSISPSAPLAKELWPVGDAVGVKCKDGIN